MQKKFLFIILILLFAIILFLNGCVEEITQKSEEKIDGNGILFEDGLYLNIVDLNDFISMNTQINFSKEDFDIRKVFVDKKELGVLNSDKNICRIFNTSLEEVAIPYFDCKIKLPIDTNINDFEISFENKTFFDDLEVAIINPCPISFPCDPYSEYLGDSLFAKGDFRITNDYLYFYFFPFEYDSIEKKLFFYETVNINFEFDSYTSGVIERFNGLPEREFNSNEIFIVSGEIKNVSPFDKNYLLKTVFSTSQITNINLGESSKNIFVKSGEKKFFEKEVIIPTVRMNTSEDILDCMKYASFYFYDENDNQFGFFRNWVKNINPIDAFELIDFVVPEKISSDDIKAFFILH